MKRRLVKKERFFLDAEFLPEKVTSVCKICLVISAYNELMIMSRRLEERLYSKFGDNVIPEI